MKRLMVVMGLLCLNGCQSKEKAKDSSAAQSTDVPKLLKPDVRRVWVPPEIQEDGKVFVEGHFKFILQKGSAWSR